MNGEKPVEKLEVEDDEARFQRLQSTLEKLNASSTATPTPSFSFNPPTQRSKPHPVPPSELLSRVQAFLPEFEASNEILAQRVQNDPSSVDIERVEDDAEEYIEMNLGLGVFEQRGARPEGGSEDESMSSSSSSSSSGSGDESSDSESDDSGCDSPEANTSAPRPSETLA